MPFRLSRRALLLALLLAAPPAPAPPGTAGTGSEVGRSAVVSDDTTHVKKIVFSPALLAKCVFADPELTAGLPPHLTAATGMDALTHAIEAYVSKLANPFSDGMAIAAMRSPHSAGSTSIALPERWRWGDNQATSSRGNSSRKREAML